MAETSDEKAPAKKPRKLIFLIIGICVLSAVGAGAYIAFPYFKGRAAEASSHSQEGKAEKHEKAGKIIVKSTMNLDSFLVNLADREYSRFVKVTFRLGMEESGMGEELAGDPVVLAITRDTIISVLSSKTAEEVLSPAGKDKLRQEVKDKVNAALPRGHVREVYIMDFQVQL